MTTLTLNTDFVLRTGPYDHTDKKPASDNEGTPLRIVPPSGARRVIFIHPQNAAHWCRCGSLHTPSSDDLEGVCS